MQVAAKRPRDKPEAEKDAGRVRKRRLWGVRLALGEEVSGSCEDLSQLVLTQACILLPVSEQTDAKVQLATLRLQVWMDGCSMRQFTVKADGTSMGTCLRGAWRLKCEQSPSLQKHNGIELHVLGYWKKIGRRPKRRRTLGKGSFKPAGPSHLATNIESSVQEMKTQETLVRVPLPPGWATLSFKEQDGRLIVTEIPKACYSSASFAATAGAQVSKVAVGDAIVEINGDSLEEFIARIQRAGDSLNSCTVAGHAVGAVGKLAPSPCVSCDFIRRHAEHGLALALQMWLKAVRADTRIVLGIKQMHGVVLPSSQELPASVKVAGHESSQPSTEGKKLRDQPPLAAAYNPLKPAASTSATVSTGMKVVPSTPKPVAKVVQRVQVAGFACEELSVGTGAGPAKRGQKVVIKFQLALEASPDKAVDRGEITFKIGEEDVDGWVQGGVDMEEVIATWGPALIGMRVGGCRSVHIPSKKGFKECGGDATHTNLIFKVTLKELA